MGVLWIANLKKNLSTLRHKLNFAGQTLSHGTRTRWWACLYSALQSWSERRYKKHTHISTYLPFWTLLLWRFLFSNCALYLDYCYDKTFFLKMTMIHINVTFHKKSVMVWNSAGVLWAGGCLTVCSLCVSVGNHGRLQLHVCRLPVPTRQTVRCHLRHRGQSNPVWPTRWYL